MAKIKTAANGRRYVEIEGVIERRLAELKKRQNGNGDYRKPAVSDDRPASRKTVESPAPQGRTVPAS